MGRSTEASRSRRDADQLEREAVAERLWKRNVYAVTAACFLGFAGFTLVMPFLPLFIAQLGVTGVGSIAIWTGVSLGITPGLTALLAPAWGRLGDRYGRKIMVERSMISFVVLMTAMAFVTRAWHVLAIRIVQGIFAGYGSLSVAMAAESAPRDRMPSAIGLVQTAQRLGPAVGPVIGGVLAGLVGLRRAFLVTALLYAIGLAVVGHVRRSRGRAAARNRCRHRHHAGRGESVDWAGHVPKRPRVPELHVDDGRDLRPAVRGSQLRADSAAVC